jgi:hypothetical protein
LRLRARLEERPYSVWSKECKTTSPFNKPGDGRQAQGEDQVFEFSFDDPRLVVMTRETMDKIVMPVSKAVAACANQAMAESFDRMARKQARGLFEHINAWCVQRPVVIAALLDLRDAGRSLLMVVVDNEEPDARLGDDVADLAIDVNERFPEFPVSVMTMPRTRPSGIAAFVNPAQAVLMYADPSRARAHG